MAGVSLWLRVSWRYVLPLLLVTQALVMFNVQPDEEKGLPFGWLTDWSWMLSVWNGATLLLSPVAAAAVVAICLYSFSSDVQSGLPAQVSSWHPVAHISGAVLVIGWLVQLITLLVASAGCLWVGANALGVTFPWQLFTGPAALAASVALGALAAIVIPHVWSVPGVLFSIFLAHRIFYWHGYPELFTTEMATAVVDGRPIPIHLVATIALNLVVMVGLCASVIFIGTARSFRSSTWLVVAVVSLVISLAVFLPFVVIDAWDTYEPLP